MPDRAPAPGSADPLDVHGIVPPTVTAYNDDETVDYEATAAHARFVVDAGCHGVVSLGTNGEFPMLTPEEQNGVVEAVAAEIDDVPVLAGVGAPSTYRTVEQAKLAEAADADAVIVVTPYYYPLDDQAAVSHYRRVAEAVDVPVYVYHIPGRTGNELSLEAFGEIATIENVVGIKDSSKNVSWLGQAIDANPDLTFLAGSDALIVPSLDLGCAGAVSAVANAFPGLVVDLYEAYDAGERERAKELQSTVYRVRRAFKQGPYMAGVKTALGLRDDLNFEPGGLRSPLRVMDDAECATLENELGQLGLL